MKLFASKSNFQNFFGKEKTNPEFIKNFLNNSWEIIDLRNENNVIVEQASSYQFNLENNKIICNKPKDKTETINLLHTIALYHDLILPTILKDGYVENKQIYNLEGKLQEIPTPRIIFKKIQTPENKFYLDHPERISSNGWTYNSPPEPGSQINIEKALENFKDGSEKLETEKLHINFGEKISSQELREYIEEHNQRIISEKKSYKKHMQSKQKEFNQEDYKKLKLDSFKNFNQGTDFFIINTQCNSLEKLIETYQKALNSKTAIIISQLNGKFKPNKSLETLFASLNEEELLNLSCFRTDYWGYYEKGAKEPEISITLSNEYLPRGYDDYYNKLPPDKLINILNKLFSKKEETPYDYLNRVWKTLEHTKEFTDFLSRKGIISKKLLEKINLTKEFEAEIIEEITRNDVNTIKENITEWDRFHAIKNLEEMEFINEEIINKSIENKYKLSNLKWSNPEIFEELKSYQNKEQIKMWALNELKDNFDTYNPLIYSLLSLGFTKKELITFLPKEHIKTDAKEWFECVSDLNKKEQHKYFNKLKKQLIKENEQISIQNNLMLKEKTYFKTDKITRNFRNQSYFLVPLNLFFFKTKQYQRFIEKIGAYEIPTQPYEEGTLLYDTKRTKLKSNHIPEKFRNEFSINKYSGGKSLIGPRYNNFLARSKNNLFAKLSFLKRE